MTLLKKSALAGTILVCGSLITLAISSWVSHFSWLETGAYEHNSFPMHQFAKDTSWLAAVATVFSIGTWVLVLRRGSSRDN